MTVSIAPLVESALRAAGIPVDSVLIPDNADRSTWAVTFAASATPAQRTQAQTILASVVVDAASVRAHDFAATSRQKDVLATCALIVRAQGPAAWNAMTTAQKVTAALAQADIWVTIRGFIEDNA
ncbi:MAG: hypothetical protein ABJA98_01760 [Acidobacteriota bacterium]